MKWLKKLADSNQFISFTQPHGEHVATVCRDTYSQEDRDEMAGLIRNGLASWCGMAGDMLLMKITDKGREAADETRKQEGE